MNSISIHYNPMPTKLRTSIDIDLDPPRKRLSQTISRKFMINATFNSALPPSDSAKSSVFSLKIASAAVIFAAAAYGSFPCLHIKAEILSPPASIAEELAEAGEKEVVIEGKKGPPSNSPPAQLLKSNSEAIDSLKTLLQQKLEEGQDEEGLAFLRQLSSAQPEYLEWMFLMSRVLEELGKIQEARDALEVILTENPLSFEALLKKALLMHKSEEGKAMVRRFEDALSFAKTTENKAVDARDVELIMAHMQFLQKNVDKSFSTYDELIKEDPHDFRPYFCKGVIFSLMDMKLEAKEEFAKYREILQRNLRSKGI